MSKSTRFAPPKRLSIGLDNPSARRSNQRPKKAPKRIAFDINLGATNDDDDDNDEEDVNEGDEEDGESFAPRDPAPNAFFASKETVVARNARKVQKLNALRVRQEELLRHRQEQARRQREFREKKERRTREHNAKKEQQARKYATIEEQALRNKKERCALQDRAR